MTTIDSALLEGRTASCGCGAEMPSSQATTQPFFTYRGPGTSDEVCVHCSYCATAHEYDPSRAHPEPAAATLGHDFAPRHEGFATDSFYCGDYTIHPAGLD